MADNLLEIDSAMNLIKEEIIRDLYESVSRQNNEPYISDVTSKSLSFSEKSLD